jgi:hypothetical protein
MTRDGFPHSEISGSKRACRSPKLIAAYHVLHRLLMPRHPLCALSSLTKKLWSTPLARVVLDTHLYAVVKDQSRLRGKTRTSKLEIRNSQCPTSKAEFSASTQQQGWLAIRSSELFRPGFVFGLRPRLCRGMLPSRLRSERSMVGVPGIEPGTSSLSGTRSNQLSYTPYSQAKAGLPSRSSELGLSVVPALLR